jgi:hypothetical protein
LHWRDVVRSLSPETASKWAPPLSRLAVLSVWGAVCARAYMRLSIYRPSAAARATAPISKHSSCCAANADGLTPPNGPQNGPTTGGASITVSGASFLDSDSTPTLYFGNSLKPCKTASWTSTTSATCLVPAGSGKGWNVNLMDFSGVFGHILGYFSYDGEHTPSEATFRTEAHSPRLLSSRAISWVVAPSAI